MADPYQRPAPRTSAITGTQDFQSTFNKARQQWKTSLATRRSATTEGHLSHQLDYAAAKDSDLRRTRQFLGGTADSHSYIWREYWEMREYARDFDRNDVLVGQMVDRAVDNVVGGGFECDPQPGDKDLAKEMKAGWLEWWEDPQQSDLAARHSGSFYARLVERHRLVDGDVFVRLFHKGPHKGKLQYLEGDRVDSPGRIDDDVIHGIQIDDYGAPEIYHVLKHKATQQKWRRYFVPDIQNTKAFNRVRAKDKFGRPRMLHIYEPSRITQTRGISAFHAVFDYLGMFEDVNFAKLVQQQVVSCISAFVTSERDVQLGARESETDTIDGSDRFKEGLEPGKIVHLLRGESMQGFSPSVPNAEFFPHVQLLLRLIGGAIGLPIEITLMDTTNTTFHGYRGALQQAYMGFRRRQKLIRQQFYNRIYPYWAENWLEENHRLPERGSKAWKQLMKVKFTPPSWPYVDPKKDADADVVMKENMIESPRGIVATRGRDWDDVVTETVEDYGQAIEAAVERAKDVESRTGVSVDWREFLGKSVFVQTQIGPEIEARTEKTEEEVDKVAADAEKSSALADKAKADAKAVKDGPKTNGVPDRGGNAGPKKASGSPGNSGSGA